MKNLTIGKKIALGFASLVLITAILGGVASVKMLFVEGKTEQLTAEFIPEAELGTHILTSIRDVQLAMRSKAMTDEVEAINEANRALAQFDKYLADAQNLSQAHPDLAKLKAHLVDFERDRKHVADMIARSSQDTRDLLESRKKLDHTAADFIKNIDGLIHSQNERLNREIKDFSPAEKLTQRHQKIQLATSIRAQGNAARIAVFKGQALRDISIIEGNLSVFDSMDKYIAELRNILRDKADLDELSSVEKDAHEYRDAMLHIIKDLRSMAETSEKLNRTVADVVSGASEIAEAGLSRTVAAASESHSNLTTALFVVVIGLITAVVIGVVVAWWIIRIISSALTRTASSLSSASEQITAAAGEVSSSSQSLAQGASEQAASLEETSASMEEISSMTKRNSESALEAKTLAQTTRTAADSGATSVNRLNTAMEELKRSSTEVSKIVKTIDEIAFQTNILALNAAVEAARAGEAGAGFAVVADEVRALAQRSAQAAKETANKIETALTKSEEGARISGEVSSTLNSIIERIRQLDALVAEIAQASSEQSSGISQVSNTVTEMDKVTQANAAAAEESASAAEELNAQALELNSLIGELMQMVGAKLPTEPVATNNDGIVISRSTQPRKQRSATQAQQQPSQEFVTSGQGSDQFFR